MPENAAHEVRISNLEKNHDAMTAALSSLAVDMRKLADTMIRAEEDRAALARAFAAIDKVRVHTEQNETRIEQIETERLKDTIRAQKTEIDDARRTRGQITAEIIKAIIIFATGAIAMHFGVKVLG